MRHILKKQYYEVVDICNRYGIKGYSLNNDGTVDINRDVDLNHESLSELPLTFNRVDGNFWCGGNNLLSLKGSPRYIGGNFLCADNKLVSLIGGPIEVVNSFVCRDNLLKNLLGSPRKIGGDFICSNNKLVSLKGCTKDIPGDFYCSNNKITSLEYCPNIELTFCCNYNFLRTLKGCSQNVDRFFCENNPLPDEIFDNINYIKDILRLQDDYGIWNKDGSLNKYRFDDMMEEILT